MFPIRLSLPAVVAVSAFFAGMAGNIGGYTNRPLANVLLVISAVGFAYVLFVMLAAWGRQMKHHVRMRWLYLLVAVLGAVSWLIFEGDVAPLVAVNVWGAGVNVTVILHVNHDRKRMGKSWSQLFRSAGHGTRFWLRRRFHA